MPQLVRNTHLYVPLRPSINTYPLQHAGVNGRRTVFSHLEAGCLSLVSSLQRGAASLSMM